jgi:hypothetical protein
MPENQDGDGNSAVPAGYFQIVPLGRRNNICRRPASPSWISAVACSGRMRRSRIDLTPGNWKLLDDVK